MKFDAYIICTAPRSGSTLLCRLLRQTRVAGYPESWFHEPSLKAWMDDYDIKEIEGQDEQETLASVFRAALSRGRSESRLFALRLQRHSFDFFMAKLAVLYPEPRLSQRGLIETAFGSTLFIHLSRRDKLAQAISYVKAEQSGLWHRSSDGTELERLAPPREPSYNANQIRRQRDELSAYDQAWRDWFEQEGVEPVEIAYETLAERPHQVLEDLLVELGLDRKAAREAAPDVARLSDEGSRQWAERFLREEGIG